MRRYQYYLSNFIQNHRNRYIKFGRFFCRTFYFVLLLHLTKYESSFLARLMYFCTALSLSLSYIRSVYQSPFYFSFFFLHKQLFMASNSLEEAMLLCTCAYGHVLQQASVVSSFRQFAPLTGRAINIRGGGRKKGNCFIYCCLAPGLY